MSERLCPVTEQPCVILTIADEFPGIVTKTNFGDGTKIVVDNTLNAGEAIEIAVQFPSYCKDYQSVERCGAIYGRFLVLKSSL